MALRTEDELDGTSEIISEVAEDDNEEVGEEVSDDQEDDIEHPVTQPDEVTLVLIEDAKRIGARFQSVNKEIDVWRPTIIALKDKFRVTKGYQGIRIVVYGHPMFWNEFCETYFGVGARRVNQLINDSDKKDNRTVVTKPDSDKPLWKKGYTRAVEDLTAKGMIVPPVSEHREPFTPQPMPMPKLPTPTRVTTIDVGKDNVVEIAQKRAIDETDEYACFHRCDSLQTLVVEIAVACISHPEIINDGQDDKMLLDLLKKELKKQRKEIADAKPKANAAAGD
jgi:hypothetical protein